MNITYNKETREWTIVCSSNVEYGRLLDCALFAKCAGDDEWAYNKRRELLETRQMLQQAFNSVIQ